MSRGFPSMTALLGLLAVAGFQNRDKIAEMLGGGQHAGSVPQSGSGFNQGASTGGLGGALSSVLGGGGGMGAGGAGGSGLSGGLGGLLSSLGGAMGGAGAGSLINGGIGDLVERFRQNGKGDVADSWVGSGPNKQIAPQDLRQAIGPDVLDQLQQHTGLSHDELLQRLSTTLPSAIDQYTPDGRVPS